MARGRDMFVGVVREGSAGGTAGRPGKEEEEAVMEASDDGLVSDALKDIWFVWLVANRFTFAINMFSTMESR